MIYIYEGVDLSGKSTLAESHSEKMSIPIIKKKLEVFKHTRRKWLQGPEIELITQMFFESIYPLGAQYDFILDRGLLSSLVYSKFFNRDVDISYIYDYISGPLSQYIKIFLVFTKKDCLKERYQNRGEKIFTLEELIQIQQLYLDTYDTLKENLKDINIELIENC